MLPRDTDTDWEQIAASEPYFGVLSFSKFLSKNLDKEALSEFYESGRAYVTSVLNELHPLIGARRLRSTLDFGCGAGRLVIPMAKVCDQAIGIDIAANMRKLTRDRANGNGVSNLGIYKDIDDVPAGVRCDWVNSYIVFQHIPPVRGYAILEKLLERLTPGGVVSLHFGLFRDRTALDISLKDVEFFRVDGHSIQTLTATAASEQSPYMSMFDYDMNALLAIFYRHGIVSMRLRYGLEGGHFGVMCFGAKSPADAYSLGQSVSFTSSARNHRLLRKGFAPPESWGVWTVGEVAEIALPVDIPPAQALQIRIAAHAYAPKVGDTQAVTVCVNDVKLGELHVARGEPQEFTVGVPSQVASASYPLKIGLNIHAPVSPAEVGEGNDFRKLGLALRALCVSPAE